MAELDASKREDEKGFTTREQVSQTRNELSDAYLILLNSRTPELLQSTLDTAFGSFPMSMAITFPADRLRDYTQTI